MGDRTRNILIGLIVLFGVIMAGGVFFGPSLREGSGPGGPGAAAHAQARKLMEEGKFGEAEQAFMRLIQQHPRTPVAERARVDRAYGIPYHQALRLAQSGGAAQAQAMLRRVAQDGPQTEWGPKARAELSRLEQQGPAAVTPAPVAEVATAGAPAAGGPAGGSSAQLAARKGRLAQANALLEQGRSAEARAIYETLVAEDAADEVASAARLSLAALQVASQAVRTSPEVGRARAALLRARASLLAYRSETGRFPPSLQAPRLESFGFSYGDLEAEVRRVEAYRPDGGGRFELIVVARDGRGTRLRATDQSVEELP